jgi:hypothetical protein
MPNIILTEAELQTILDWEHSRASQFRLDGSQENVDVVLPLARNKGFGKITPASLDAAVAISFRSLKYMPSQEHPCIKQQLAEKAQSERDKLELERKRKRDAEVKACIGPNQSRIRTELDRVDDDKAAEVSKNAEAQQTRRAQEAQLEFKEEFERIANTYTVNRGSRVDYAKTQERREALRQITTIRQNGVIRYDKMVAVAQEMVKKFEASRTNITW